MKIVIADQTATVSAAFSAPEAAEEATPSNNKDNGSKAKVPRGHINLEDTDTTTISEISILKADVDSLESWWKEPRWDHTKRNYSGKYMTPPSRCSSFMAVSLSLKFLILFLTFCCCFVLSFLVAAIDVACLRPSNEARGGNRMAPNVSFSSQQSDKLWSLLNDLQEVGGYSHTFGALDPVQVIQMAPHLSSIYVSGWQCSSTASTTNDPGPGKIVLLPLSTIAYHDQWSSIRIFLQTLRTTQATLSPTR